MRPQPPEIDGSLPPDTASAVAAGCFLVTLALVVALLVVLVVVLAWR